jgi:hypothetical protein
MQKDLDPFALPAFQHATPFGLRFSAIEVFVWVLRDQSFREPL